VQWVTEAGAGLFAPRRWQLLRALGELRRDPMALTAMRAASAGLGRPGAAAVVAALLAGLTGVAPPGAATAGAATAGARRTLAGAGWHG
jgi:hypothetical protein